MEHASREADYRVFGLLMDAVAASWIRNVVSKEVERRAVIASSRLVDAVMKKLIIEKENPQKEYSPS